MADNDDRKKDVTSGNDGASPEEETVENVTPAQEATSDSSEETTETVDGGDGDEAPEEEIPSDDDSDVTDPSVQDMTLEELQAEVTRLRGSLAAADEEKEAAVKDAVLRVQAATQNLIRRADIDAGNTKKAAVQKFALDLLNFADNFDRAIQALPEDVDEGIRIGLETMQAGLSGVFNKHGIVEFESEGQPFDPKFHEVLMQAPSEDLEPGTVAAVIQKGYTIDGRILRHAQVAVSVAPAPKAEEEGSEVETPPPPPETEPAEGPTTTTDAPEEPKGPQPPSL
jgi:molecular chaperone GrpE